MEKLLHYIWKHRIMPLHPLQDTEGRTVEIIDPGLPNRDQGPDFLNAKVRIGAVVWAGSVEMHTKASDWLRHGHDSDPAYNNVVLHVVLCADRTVMTADGTVPPQMEIEIPGQVAANYDELRRTEDFPRCYRVLPDIPAIKVHMWMDALLAERLKEKTDLITERVRRTGGDWERAAFVTLSRNFGFGLNGDSFEKWAYTIPMSAAGKHRDNLLQIEALFLGQAGLIEEPHGAVEDGDPCTEARRKEYGFLAHKFSLPAPMEKREWKFLRTRPQNFPQTRMLQLARLYHSGKAGMSALLEIRDADETDNALACAGLSRMSRRLLIINTVVPLLYAYGTHHNDDAMKQKATTLLERLPAEENFIMRQWRMCGISVDNAADSQALIQLKREYCDRKDCLRCRFAYDYLKRTEQNTSKRK